MQNLQAERKVDKFVEIAKSTVEEYVACGKVINLPENLPAEFYSRRAGVFVTIYEVEEVGNMLHGHVKGALRGLPRSHAKRVLRGCIGTFLPTKKNIAEEIISNAVAACSRDHRFTPIVKEELSKLNYEVSILSEPRILKNLDSHDPKKHGIIVKCADGRCGLLLPDLEDIDTTEQQIEISCQKGGINPQLDHFELYQFTVEKHR